MTLGGCVQCKAGGETIELEGEELCSRCYVEEVPCEEEKIEKTSRREVLEQAQSTISRIKDGKKVGLGQMKPLLKYIGSKRKLAPTLAAQFKPTKRLVEMFAGSGALTFYMEPERALWIDANPDLILFYSAVKHKTDALWQQIYKLQKDTSREAFNAARQFFSRRFCPGRYYYLNRVGYGGIMRYNADGKFNTPYGNYKNPRFINRKELFEAALFMQRVGVVCQSALRTDHIEKGDAVFADAPYYGTFSNYTKGGFTNEDHQDLAQRLEELRTKGCQVVATNSDCKEVRKLYPKKRWKHIEADSQSLRTGRNRNKPELILVAK